MARWLDGSMARFEKPLAAEEVVAMKNVTKIVLAVVAAVTTMLQVPAVHNLVIAAIAAHPDAAALVAGVSAVLALLHDPKAVN
jgi:hypothetical protein